MIHKPMSTQNTSVSNRIGHIETQISGLASSLDGFIKESAEYRARTEREQTQLWAAIREQGDNLRNAVEKLSVRGQISWGAIVTTGAFILALIGAGAGVNNALLESRIRQLEIRDEDTKALRESQLETERTRSEFILRIAEENHQAILSLQSK